MSWTKREIISAALEELGLASYVFDMTTDQFQSALRRLDSMIAVWATNGIRINYPMASSPDQSELDIDSGVPGFCAEAIVTNLAIRLAPSYGKTVSVETKMIADLSFSNLLTGLQGDDLTMNLPEFMPKGAGTKPWRTWSTSFTNKLPKEIQTSGDSTLDFF